MRRLTALAAALVIGGPAAAASDSFSPVWHETGLDRVAVQSGGRLKALVTFARDHLRGVTLRRLTRDDDPITLVLRLASAPGQLAERWILPVEGDDLLPHLAAAGVEVRDRTVRLADAFTFDAHGHITGEGPAIQAARGAAMSAPEGSPLHTAALRLFSRISEAGGTREALRVFPHPTDAHGAWSNLDGEAQAGHAGSANAVQSLSTLLAAVADDDVSLARLAARALTVDLQALPNAPPARPLAIDYAYTQGKPFFWASLAYVLAGTLFFVALVSGGRRWWAAAVAMMSLGLILNVAGAIARGYLLGRMPLSNLYEATTTGLAFIIVFALILEVMYRTSVIGMASAFLSFVYYRWLVSSDMFGNDAIEPLRAVLNSFWLDYHVTTLMLSYGAFTIAFAMATMHLAKDRWPRLMRWSPSADDLDVYTYRAIQFGWPLLGIGIVLGAVWADTAWGRMWSWDPKETWALITWLIYTAYLHVRLVHGWKGTVMAWASVVGYAAVLFTYLGVNFVLSGLHSYAGPNAAITVSPASLLTNPWVVVALVLVTLGTVSAVVKHRRHAALESSKP